MGDKESVARTPVEATDVHSMRDGLMTMLIASENR